MLFGLASTQCQHSSLGTLRSLHQQQHRSYRPLLEHTAARSKRSTSSQPKSLAPPAKDTQSLGRLAEQLQAAADLELKVSGQQHGHSADADIGAKQPSSLRGAGRVLRALCHYSPQDPSDGPASLSKVRPYNASEVEAALQHAMQQQLLPKLDLQQLSNIACALAAAGHLSTPFMLHLGDTAAAQIRAAPRLLQPAQSLQAFRALCWLAVGFSRLGVLHPQLMEQIALYGTHILSRSPIQFSRQKHGQQIALMAGAFAALKLYPPQLFDAIGEQIKQHRHVMSLLGAQESMLLLWALARVAHKDPPAQLWITQRAATQVGQLTCQGLAHAYSQCAQVGITSAPLLAALRKACRNNLTSMQPADLSVLLTGLAALGQQELLYLDEISRAVYNKLANFTAAEVSASMAALAALRYRNPWLLEQISKILVSRKLQKTHQLTAQQLADILRSCQQLEYVNPLLLGHLGSVAAEVQLQGCTAAELAAIVAWFKGLGFYQPQLLQAAAVRLLQLVLQVGGHDHPAAAAGAGAGAIAAADAAAGGAEAIDQHLGQQQQLQEQQEPHQQQQQQPSELPSLISAAFHLALMPNAGGSRAEKAVLPAALLGLTMQAPASTMQQQQQKQGQQGQQQAQQHQQVIGLQDLVSLQTALLLCISTRLAGLTAGLLADASAAAGGEAGTQQQQQLAGVTAQLLSVQQQVQAQVQQQLAAVVAACSDTAAAVEALEPLPGLLQCMQLTWLVEQSRSSVEGAPAAAAAATAGQAQVAHWQLGLPDAVAAAYVQQQRQLAAQQQLQQGSKRPALRAVAAAATRQLQGLAPDSTQQQQWQVSVQVLYSIPDSPLVVPIAVLSAPAAVAARPAAAAAPAAADSSAEQQEGQKMQQQEGRAQPGVFLQLQVARLQQRKLHLPAEALEQVVASQRAGRPLAIFIEAQLGTGAAAEVADSRCAVEHLCLSRWFTCNSPQQLLPAAQMWRQGLLQRGWDVLVLEEYQSNDSEADSY